jgi:hypothetical protein
MASVRLAALPSRALMKSEVARWTELTTEADLRAGT